MTALSFFGDGSFFLMILLASLTSGLPPSIIVMPLDLEPAGQGRSGMLQLGSCFICQ